MSKQTIADRLKNLRAIRRMSQAQLAQASGVSQTTIAGIESGRSAGSRYVVEIARALGAPPEWLLTGIYEGEEIEINAAAQNDAVERLREFGSRVGRKPMRFAGGGEAIGDDSGSIITWDRQDELPHDPKRVWIDRYDYRFSAGDGHTQWEIREKNALPFNEGFFKAIGSNPANCKLVMVHGRSMENFLFDKDMIMVDTSLIQPREEKIYSLWLEDEPLVKQVFKRPGGGLILHSFNPAFPDKIIEPEHMDRLKIFGQCVYRSGSGFL
ncbi:Bacteriophage repressor protein CI [Paraburkholderia tropica]